MPTHVGHSLSHCLIFPCLQMMSGQEMRQLANIPVLTKDLYEMPQRTPLRHGPLDPRLVRFRPYSFNMRVFIICIILIDSALHSRCTINPSSCDVCCWGHLTKLHPQGTSDKSARCETCGLGLSDCAGHFGVVTLEMPVFHVGFFKATVSILQRICKARQCMHYTMSSSQKAHRHAAEYC